MRQTEGLDINRRNSSLNMREMPVAWRNLAAHTPLAFSHPLYLKGGAWLILTLCCIFGVGGGVLSCSDGLVDNKYSNLPARFSFWPVNSISQLYTSCESMGEWCTITLSSNGSKFLFTKADGSQGEANREALDGYTGFYMGLGGFLVGLPNIPEMGETYSVVTCYDLACRNCYEETDFLVRKLTLQENGKAYCSRCQRTYNLNNLGQVSQGETGKALYRYRVYYGNNTLSINNK